MGAGPYAEGQATYDRKLGETIGGVEATLQVVTPQHTHAYSGETGVMSSIHASSQQGKNNLQDVYEHTHKFSGNTESAGGASVPIKVPTVTPSSVVLYIIKQ